MSTNTQTITAYKPTTFKYIMEGSFARPGVGKSLSNRDPSREKSTAKTDLDEEVMLSKT